MKKLKSLIIVIVCAGLATPLNAQSGLTLEASQLFTSFKFSDSRGNDLSSDYSGIFTGAYNLGYRHVSPGGIMVSGGLGMHNAGSTLVYDAMNYMWDLKYAGGRLGVGYMLQTDRMSPYLNISGYYAYLLRGYQIINNQHFNITSMEVINTMDYGLYLSPGVQLRLSDAVSTYLEFNYLMGLANLERDESQEARNMAYGLTLGLSLSIVK
jgi:hypothetical protein